jgi:RNA polymerase sigma-70 factor (ECF subfamily)
LSRGVSNKFSGRSNTSAEIPVIPVGRPAAPAFGDLGGRSIVDQDRADFQSLLDEHGAATLALLRRLSGNPHDADDLFQEVAVRVWRNRKARPILRNARGWISTIAYRAFVDHLAARPCHATLEDDDRAFFRVGPDRDRDPVAIAEVAERARLLDSAVARLSPPLRTVIVLHYTGGLSLREVARAAGISVGTVKSRLNAGLEQLRGRLT